MNNNTRQLATAAICAALSFVFLAIGSATGVLDMTAVVICGLISVILSDNVKLSYAVSSVAVCAVLAFFLLPDKALGFLYVTIGGAFPILKPYCDRLKKPFNMIVKIPIFAAAAAGYTFLFSLLMPDDFNSKMLIPGLLIAAVAFILYDYIIGKFVLIYRKTYSRIFKKRGQ